MEPHFYSSECPFKTIDDIKNKNITIMGLGLNGGGEATVRFFLKKGANVLVTDMKTQTQLQETIDRLNNDNELDKSRLTYRLGEHKIEDFKNADCVIKNPGIKFEGNKFLASAKFIETDLSIFLRFTNCPIIAVTGSKGKSSTVSAIYYGLKNAGFKTFLGGNITVSPLTFFDKVNSDTPVVIEFSSWQLSDLRGRGVLKPYISIITKIVPDHQNWYENMESYVLDKKLIYQNQTKGDYSIFDSDDWGNVFSSESKATVFHYQNQKKFGVWLENHENGTFEGKILLPNMEKPQTILTSLCVPGEHIKINCLNAAFVMFLMGVEANKICEILANFPGIEHRLQFFYEWKNQNGVNFKFYNDSSSTVPESTIAATKSFGKKIHLICGGTEKGLSLKNLSDSLITEQNTSSIFLLEGSATTKITEELDKSKVEYFGAFSSLENLLNCAKNEFNKLSKIQNEQIVVFSPGATSFGMFNNEFDRGNKFMQKVKDIFL